MIDANDIQPADTLEDADDRQSSKVLLEVISNAQEYFRPYLTLCTKIDEIYSRTGEPVTDGFTDQDFDMFWASMEILKPAIYARPPKPVASPAFDDRDITVSTTADVLERCLSTSVRLGRMDRTMLGARDDLALANRGVIWVRYENEGEQRVCYEHLDRADFLHDPARDWSAVGWTARRGWMTLDAMEKRFKKIPSYELQRATFSTSKDEGGRRDDSDGSKKAGVWEVWSRADGRVYWVVEGVDVILDEGKPHLDLKDFFPCPEPAYGSLRRRTLIPVPDWSRYASLLEQINDLTSRVYDLLDELRLRGFFNSSTDRGTAINTLFADKSQTMKLIGLDSSLTAGGSGDAVQWLPLEMIATTIQGMLAARGQLIQDFYQLSGISDIMRGASEAQETLGAQRLKQQNGSVRVKDKQNELERIAADAIGIAAEIIAANFSAETILDMCQMKVRKKAEIQSDIKNLEATAKKELTALADQAEEMAEQAQASGQPVDPKQAEQAEAQFNEQQQAIIAKYQPKLTALGKEVPIESVMKLLRDEQARNFVIEVETDSTVLTDEIAAKASASEFYSAFTAGLSGLAGAAAMGPEAVKMATEVFKMTLAPYRPSRSVIAAIDEFVDAAPDIAARMAQGQDQGNEAQAGMQQLAEIEMKKVELQGQKAQADAQAKMQELQLKAQTAEAKAQTDGQKMMLETEKLRAQIGVQNATIEKIYAEIQALGVKGQIEGAWIAQENRSQDRADVELMHNMQTQAVDRVQSADESARNHAMGERQQARAEADADRSMSLAERQAESKGNPNG